MKVPAQAVAFFTPSRSFLPRTHLLFIVATVQGDIGDGIVAEELTARIAQLYQSNTPWHDAQQHLDGIRRCFAIPSGPKRRENLRPKDFLFVGNAATSVSRGKQVVLQGPGLIKSWTEGNNKPAYTVVLEVRPVCPNQLCKHRRQLKAELRKEWSVDSSGEGRISLPAALAFCHCSPLQSSLKCITLSL